MSISLPNGTLLAASSSSHLQLSAAVTRILHLANFSAELKTRDLQLMFKEWDNDKGGYRIKWLDDTHALVVFADANVAKRAYLSFLLNPPPSFTGSIRPYDRPDAAQIIQSLASRALGHRSSMSNAVNGGGAPFPFPANNDPAAPQVHSRAMSVTNIHHSKTGSISGALPGSSSGPHAGSLAAPTQRRGHHRSGSGSSSWARTSLSGGLGGLAGLAGGALSFPTNASSRPTLPTHDESSGGPPSRSGSSSSGEAVVLVDPSAMTGMRVTSNGGPKDEADGDRKRRDSVSADKALREVQKALASVETQG
ncbi:hypothetical protein J008_06102 [Cryptococcus neoformans]|nr:hypothetical protein C362_05260 [Cryptococcus neoformans var. grubii Bt1]OXG13516.1 hypothetical protein C367_06062 [Cryptococcus neoformans var. grubii Ze90-1]OXH23428.1 hypothetical protein J008_06102 [Cryptococcus neoformans var. grubii]